MRMTTMRQQSSIVVVRQVRVGGCKVRDSPGCSSRGDGSVGTAVCTVVLPPGLATTSAYNTVVGAADAATDANLHGSASTLGDISMIGDSCFFFLTGATISSFRTLSDSVGGFFFFLIRSRVPKILERFSLSLSSRWPASLTLRFSLRRGGTSWGGFSGMCWVLPHDKLSGFEYRLFNLTLAVSSEGFFFLLLRSRELKMDETGWWPVTETRLSLICMIRLLLSHTFRSESKCSLLKVKRQFRWEGTETTWVGRNRIYLRFQIGCPSNCAKSWVH